MKSLIESELSSIRYMSRGTRSAVRDSVAHAASPRLVVPTGVEPSLEMMLPASLRITKLPPIPVVPPEPFPDPPEPPVVAPAGPLLPPLHDASVVQTSPAANTPTRCE